MSIPVGGYQMVDISDVTLTAQAVTVTNAKNADILRKTSKPVYFHGAKIGTNTIVGLATAVADTGAVDGKVYNVVTSQGIYLVSTNKDNITFTPASN